jgi:hypothetical protein
MRKERLEEKQEGVREDSLRQIQIMVERFPTSKKEKKHFVFLCSEYWINLPGCIVSIMRADFPRDPFPIKAAFLLLQLANNNHSCSSIIKGPRQHLWGLGEGPILMFMR